MANTYYDLKSLGNYNVYHNLIPDIITYLFEHRKSDKIKKWYYSNAEFDSNQSNLIGVVANNRLEANIILLLSRMVIDNNDLSYVAEEYIEDLEDDDNDICLSRMIIKEIVKI